METPLQGFTVFIIGRLSQSKVSLPHPTPRSSALSLSSVQAKLTQTIEGMGGKVVSKVSEKTTICLSSQGECGEEGEEGRRVAVLCR